MLKVTGEGQRSQKTNQWSNLADIIPGTMDKYNKRCLMTKFCDLDARSCLKVKGHRRGGFCAL